ncbi:lysylphosphatidylglycerol synthase transmembrane domain-containing protein [Galbibacter sp. EGI 63066]|uniref:lysylphosphatidylglycerol synthase transmembrane domain-containing protein n=1 Tax=Galbibacter sp. EGI 63066 TaxID=2993559 RepID=UPI0022488DB7|nr:lysylphosphatidylglycerol synthase transmembrane domain-containing protein [Galbibacter sp. EGI 63066]MCX2680529.1 lysylphosphatidylglycerol synthase transmembrane domain-containing protein [Galbibacter sp. EGI 63066]
MKKKLIKILKTILPLLLGVFLIWYSYSHTTPEDRESIINAIKEANYFWVIVSLFLGFLSHFFRALRWNLLLKPMGYTPSIFNNLMAIFVGYLANLGIPRSGEVLRATSISTYEDIPFQKSFGTIIAERVIDVIMLLLIIFITGVLQTEIIADFFMSKDINITKLIIITGIIGILGLFFLWLVKKAKNGFFGKVKTFVQGLIEGVTSIFKMKKKWLFIFYTFCIWILYIGMFWIVKFSLPETANLPISAILAAFVAGAFAMSATNGGIGLYPIAVSKMLLIYGISKASGDAFGWIMWSSQTIMVVIFGALSFLFLPIYNRTRS